MSGITDTWHQK